MRRLKQPGAVTVKPRRQDALAAFVDLGLLGGAGTAALPALDLRIEFGGGVVLHLLRR